jgi:poly-gamma-glutamate synthesis protein (capsule biosynthesis protein)
MSGRLVVWWQLMAVSLLAVTVVVLHLSVVLPTTDHSPSSDIVPVPHASTASDAIEQIQAEYTYDRVWFTGDVMLSRQVGQFAEERGADYPWRRVESLFGTRDAVVINFEACLSNRATFDWNDSMKFPVTPALLPAIVQSGITHASLANNHSFDCGIDDFAFTKSQLASAGVSPFGHPLTVTELSVSTTTVGNYTVGIVALHTLYENPGYNELSSLISRLKAATDYQVAYIHWGVEYELSSHESQQVLAQQLASHGIDLIVGHHPHVVQEIAQVGDTVIFYSLGNFIFDQYFSPEVQEGLVVVLEPVTGLQARLVPVSSVSARTQPAPLHGEEREQFLQLLAARSDPTLQTAIMNATIPLAYDLATSTKPRMIAP